jgi:hypothetical protein
LEFEVDTTMEVSDGIEIGKVYYRRENNFPLEVIGGYGEWVIVIGKVGDKEFTEPFGIREKSFRKEVKWS